MKLTRKEIKLENEQKRLGKKLLNACYFGNVKETLSLIKQGAQIDYTSPTDGWYTIHYAARWGMIKTLDALVEKGIDVNLRTTDGRETALHKACRTNRKNICIFLLKNGANPTLLNTDRQRASELCDKGELCFIVDNFVEYIKLQCNIAGF